MSPVALPARMTVVVVVGLLASCAGDDPTYIASAGDFGHVHDLVVDGEDVLVATHTGLYRVRSPEEAVLVGESRRDLMSMTTDGTDLLASGHPGVAEAAARIDENYRRLGLSRSTDGGETWTPDSLDNQADFHSLVVHEDGIYAAEGGGTIWHRDPDGHWTTLGDVDAWDLAIDSEDSARQVAIDGEGNVWASSDGAASWTQASSAPTLAVVEWLHKDLVIGFDAEGRMFTTADPTQPWSESGTAPTGIEAFHIDSDGRWWMASAGGSIARSVDAGQRWEAIFDPPTTD